MTKHNDVQDISSKMDKIVIYLIGQIVRISDWLTDAANFPKHPQKVDVQFR